MNKEEATKIAEYFSDAFNKTIDLVGVKNAERMWFGILYELIIHRLRDPDHDIEYDTEKQ